MMQSSKMADLTLCCIQEVRYRNQGHKIIETDTGDKYEFIWCGPKKCRDAGVGIVIKVDPRVTITNPEFNTPRVMALNIDYTV